MVLEGHPSKLFEAHPVVLVGVLHPSLGEHPGHRFGAQHSVDPHHGSVTARRLVDPPLLLGCAGQQAHLAHLLDSHREPHVCLSGPYRQVDSSQSGGTGGAGVGHVVDGDAGLADLLLEPLAHAGTGLVERAGR